MIWPYCEWNIIAVLILTKLSFLFKKNICKWFKTPSTGWNHPAHWSLQGQCWRRANRLILLSRYFFKIRLAPSNQRWAADLPNACAHFHIHADQDSWFTGVYFLAPICRLMDTTFNSPSVHKMHNLNMWTVLIAQELHTHTHLWGKWSIFAPLKFGRVFHCL